MRFLLALFLLCSAPCGALWAQAEVGFERGIHAYRRAEYGEAETLWRETLEEELTTTARARLYYNLGNVSWRQDRPMEAVGWYRACLRIAPRHAEAWNNLEFVQAESGLEPTDRGDLRSTVRRALLALRPAEARLAAFGALGLLAFMLFLEAFVGGRLWRRLSFLSGLLTIVCSLPFFYRLGDSAQDPMLVVRGPTVSLRSEPHPSRAPIGELNVGEEVQRVDSLPGWVRVTRADGTLGWVQEEALFPLRP